MSIVIPPWTVQFLMIFVFFIEKLGLTQSKWPAKCRDTNVVPCGVKGVDFFHRVVAWLEEHLVVCGEIADRWL